MRGVGGLLHCTNHSVGEAAGAAYVGIRAYMHAVRRERRGVEGAPVVDDVHGEVRSDIVVAAQDLALYKRDVGLDIALFLERGGGQREFNIARLARELHGVGAVLDCDTTLCLDLEAHEDGILRAYEFKVDVMPTVGGGGFD